jgi:hypothetical protein
VLWNGTKTQLIDQTTTNASGVYTLTSRDPGNYDVISTTAWDAGIDRN